jgi:hypothetical protein
MSWPATELTGLTATINGVAFQLDVRGMYDAWGPQADQDFKSRLAARQIRPGEYLVSGVFSGEAGLYVAEWRITGARATRTLLSDNEAVVQRVVLSLTK